MKKTPGCLGCTGGYTRIPIKQSVYWKVFFFSWAHMESAFPTIFPWQILGFRDFTVSQFPLCWDIFFRFKWEGQEESPSSRRSWSDAGAKDVFFWKHLRSSLNFWHLAGKSWKLGKTYITIVVVSSISNFHGEMTKFDDILFFNWVGSTTT